MVKLKEGENIIAIVGLPATGKSTLSKEIGEGFKIYHTDDLLKLQLTDFIQYMNHLISSSKATKYIIEGCLVYKLLRDGYWFYPDVVIECVASEGTRQARYNKERGMKNFKAFDNVYRNLLMESKRTQRVKMARHVQYLTE